MREGARWGMGKGILEERNNLSKGKGIKVGKCGYREKRANTSVNLEHGMIEMQ